MSDLSVPEIFEKMPQAFLSERADGLSGIAQFLISGEDGGEWVVTIANRQCQVTAGRTDSPQVTVSADATLLPDLLAGRQSGMMAFLQGKLRIQGDVSLAQRMLGVFSLP